MSDGGSVSKMISRSPKQSCVLLTMRYRKPCIIGDAIVHTPTERRFSRV